MIKVSLIVAVYNTVPIFLDKCVDSLLHQSMRDIEILLIDDGSEIDCADQCDKYAEIDPRIRVIHKNNEGVSAASNLGISEAKGEFVTFVDHDDYIDLNMCELAYNKAKELDVDALAFSYYSYSNSKTIRGYYKGADEVIYEKADIENFLAQIIHVKACSNQEIAFAGANWGKIYKTEKLRATGAQFPYGMQGGEDAVFTFCAIKGLERVEYWNQPFYYYRQNNASFTKRYREDMIETQLKHIDIMYELIENRSDLEMKAWRMLCCDSLFSIGAYLFRPENTANYADKRKKFQETVNRWEFKSSLSEINSFNFSKKKKIILSILKHNMTDIFLIICCILLKREGKENYD